MSKITDLRSKLSSMAGIIREKKEIENQLTFDEIIEHMRDLQKEIIVGSGGSSSGENVPLIANSYVINFHNENEELKESHNLSCGNWIDKPMNLTAEKWVTRESGIVNMFPLTSYDEQTYNLYPFNGVTYADKLYEHFGVNPQEYPFMVYGSITGSKAYFAFFKTLSYTDGKTLNGREWRKFTGDALKCDFKTSDMSVTDIEKLYNDIITKCPTVTEQLNYSMTTYASLSKFFNKGKYIDFYNKNFCYNCFTFDVVYVEPMEE